MDGYQKTSENGLNRLQGNTIFDVRAVDENFTIHEDKLGSIDSVELDGFSRDSDFSNKKSVVNYIKYIWKKLNAIELTDTKVKITTDSDKLLSVVLRDIKNNASSLLEKINTNKNTIGTLTSLKTKEKNNIVGAVNEVVDNIEFLPRENILTGSTNEWIVKIFDRDRYSDRVTVNSTAIIPANKIDRGKKYVLSFIMEVSDLVYDSGATYHTQAFANGSDATRNAWSQYGYFDSANKTIKVTFPIDFDRVFRIGGTEIEYFGVISVVFRMVRSGTIKFKELKLEEGEIPTPWCLSTSEIVSINKNINALTRKITSNNAELNRLNTEFRITNGGA